MPRIVGVTPPIPPAEIALVENRALARRHSTLGTITEAASTSASPIHSARLPIASFTGSPSSSRRSSLGLTKGDCADDILSAPYDRDLIRSLTQRARKQGRRFSIGRKLIDDIKLRGKASPPLDKALTKSLGLDSRLDHCLVEHITHDKPMQVLFGFAPQARTHGPRTIISVKAVSCFNENTQLLSPSDKGWNAEPIAGLALQTNQQWKLILLGVNKKLQYALFIRNVESGAIEHVKLPPPALQSVIEEAAIKTAATWRGVHERIKRARLHQKRTPYPNKFAHAWATNMFSRAVIQERGLFTLQWKNPWRIYRSAAAIQLLKHNPYAILHSLRRPGDNNAEVIFRHLPPRFTGADDGGIAGMGHFYSPIYFHNMRDNIHWLLGLAHHAVSAILTTPLTNTTIIRRSAPLDEQTVERHPSALLREVIGMLQNGMFSAYQDERGKWIFTPHLEKARTATYDALWIEKGLSRAEVEALLAKYGLSIEEEQPDRLNMEVRFDAEGFLSQLMLDDLNDTHTDFQRLETCKYSGIEMPQATFSTVLHTLEGASPERQHRVVRLLTRMLESQHDEANAYYAIGTVAQGLHLISAPELQKEMLDALQARIASMKFQTNRTNLLQITAHYLVQAEVRRTSAEQGDFPLFDHVLNAQRSNTIYIPRTGTLAPAPTPSNIGFTSAVCAAALQGIVHGSPLQRQRAIRLTQNLIASMESPTERAESLLYLTSTVELLPENEAEEVLSFVLNQKRELADSALASRITTSAACAMAVIESRRLDCNSARLLARLDEMHLPAEEFSVICQRLAGQVDTTDDPAQRNSLQLICDLAAAIPEGMHEARADALLPIVYTLDALEDEFLVDDTLDYLSSKKDLTDLEWDGLKIVQASVLVQRAATAPATTLQRLLRYSLPLSWGLCEDVLEDIDSKLIDVQKHRLELTATLVAALPAGEHRTKALCHFAQLGSSLQNGALDAWSNWMQQHYAYCNAEERSLVKDYAAQSLAKNASIAPDHLIEQLITLAIPITEELCSVAMDNLDGNDSEMQLQKLRRAMALANALPQDTESQDPQSLALQNIAQQLLKTHDDRLLDHAIALLLQQKHALKKHQISASCWHSMMDAFAAVILKRFSAFPEVAYRTLEQFGISHSANLCKSALGGLRGQEPERQRQSLLLARAAIETLAADAKEVDRIEASLAIAHALEHLGTHSLVRDALQILLHQKKHIAPKQWTTVEHRVAKSLARLSSMHPDSILNFFNACNIPTTHPACQAAVEGISAKSSAEQAHCLALVKGFIDRMPDGSDEKTNAVVTLAEQVGVLTSSELLLDTLHFMQTLKASSSIQWRDVQDRLGQALVLNIVLDSRTTVEQLIALDIPISAHLCALTLPDPLATSSENQYHMLELTCELIKTMPATSEWECHQKKDAITGMAMVLESLEDIMRVEDLLLPFLKDQAKTIGEPYATETLALLNDVGVIQKSLANH